MNRLLLDTCAILRLATGVGELTEQALAAIADATAVFVSPVSLWEIALKVRDGKIKLPNDPAEFFSEVMENYGLTLTPLSLDVMSRSVELPTIHKDPADRFIIASALANNLTVVTTDRRFEEYGVRVIK